MHGSLTDPAERDTRPGFSVQILLLPREAQAKLKACIDAYIIGGGKTLERDGAALRMPSAAYKMVDSR
jgi:hypothetical protein